MSFLLGLPIFRGYVKFLGCINKKRHNSESRWGSTPMLRLTLSTISSKPSERSSLMAFSNTTSPAKVMTRRWYWEAPMTSMMGSSGTILVVAMPSSRYWRSSLCPFFGLPHAQIITPTIHWIATVPSIELAYDMTNDISGSVLKCWLNVQNNVCTIQCTWWAAKDLSGVGFRLVSNTPFPQLHVKPSLKPKVRSQQGGWQNCPPKKRWVFKENQRIPMQKTENKQ